MSTLELPAPTPFLTLPSGPECPPVNDWGQITCVWHVLRHRAALPRSWIHVCSRYSCPRRQGFCSSALAGCYQWLTRWAVSVLFYVRFFRYSWGYTLLQKTGLDRRTSLCFFFFFCSVKFQFSSVQSLNRVRFFATPWTTACQASLSITNSQSLFKLISIESVKTSNHLILCRPLLLSPSVFPSMSLFQ